MNWVRKTSAWEAAQAQRARRREVMAEFEARAAQLAAGFAQANTIQRQGIGELAARGAQARLDAKMKEMQAEYAKQFESFSKLV